MAHDLGNSRGNMLSTIETNIKVVCQRGQWNTEYKRPLLRRWNSIQIRILICLSMSGLEKNMTWLENKVHLFIYLFYFSRFLYAYINKFICTFWSATQSTDIEVLYNLTVLVFLRTDTWGLSILQFIYRQTMTTVMTRLRYNWCIYCQMTNLMKKIRC